VSELAGAGSGTLSQPTRTFRPVSATSHGDFDTIVAAITAKPFSATYTCRAASALDQHLGDNEPHAREVECQTQMGVRREYVDELMSRSEDLARWLQAVGPGRSPLLARGKQGQATQPLSSKTVDDCASCSRYARSCETRLAVGSVNSGVNRCDVA